jgi:type III pantothenate kinase
MSDARRAPLVAVDIGNSRIKLGWFPSAAHESSLPAPAGELTLQADAWIESVIGQSLPANALGGRWCIASVNRPATKRLLSWLNGVEHDKRPREIRELSHRDLPLDVRVPEPDRVGIDRLLAAVAANRLRDTNRPAIVIDLGSAMTFDLIAADGAFLGGAILPGVGMSARALDEFTDLLPRIPMDELAEPPPALGTSTIEAMRSGLYWGAVGAMRELIARLRESTKEHREPQVFLTGGAAPTVAQFLPGDAAYVPHLVLGGIAIVAGV